MTEGLLALNVVEGGSGGPCDATGLAGLRLDRCFLLKDGTSANQTYNQPSDLVNLIVSNLFIIAGLVIFFLILYAGFQIISSSNKALDEAKNTITTALIGLVIMFCSYWVIQILEVVLGQNILF